MKLVSKTDLFNILLESKIRKLCNEANSWFVIK